MVLTIKGEHHYLWRAVDQEGQVPDILVQHRRDTRTAKKVFRPLLTGWTSVPRVLVTDKLGSYDATKRELLPGVAHRQHRSLNNRAENSHQPRHQRARSITWQYGHSLLHAGYCSLAKGGFAMDMADLERRMTRIEDIEAIKQLKARYCEICDDNHNPNRITTLFVDDGIWEGGDFGKAHGHEAIRTLFQTFQQRISFSQHMVMNPIIEVEGNRATGVWYFFGPFTFRKPNEAKWVAVRYEDDYVKVNGEWKYQHLRAHLRMIAAYDKSWANTD